MSISTCSLLICSIIIREYYYSKKSSIIHSLFLFFKNMVHMFKHECPHHNYRYYTRKYTYNPRRTRPPTAAIARPYHNINPPHYRQTISGFLIVRPFSHLWVFPVRKSGQTDDSFSNFGINRKSKQPPYFHSNKGARSPIFMPMLCSEHVRNFWEKRACKLQLCAG